jgi:hypothetical protein
VVEGALKAKREAVEEVDEAVFVEILRVGSAMTEPAVSNFARMESKWSGK